MSKYLFTKTKTFYVPIVRAVWWNDDQSTLDFCKVQRMVKDLMSLKHDDVVQGDSPSRVIEYLGYKIIVNQDIQQFEPMVKLSLAVDVTMHFRHPRHSWILDFFGVERHAFLDVKERSIYVNTKTWNVVRENWAKSHHLIGTHHDH